MSVTAGGRRAAGDVSFSLEVLSCWMFSPRPAIATTPPCPPAVILTHGSAKTTCHPHARARKARSDLRAARTYVVTEPGGPTTYRSNKNPTLPCVSLHSSVKKWFSAMHQCVHDGFSCPWAGSHSSSTHAPAAAHPEKTRTHIKVMVRDHGRAVAASKMRPRRRRAAAGTSKNATAPGPERITSLRRRPAPPAPPAPAPPRGRRRGARRSLH